MTSNMMSCTSAVFAGHHHVETTHLNQHRMIVIKQIGGRSKRSCAQDATCARPEDVHSLRTLGPDREHGSVHIQPMSCSRRARPMRTHFRHQFALHGWTSSMKVALPSLMSVCLGKRLGNFENVRFYPTQNFGHFLSRPLENVLEKFQIFGPAPSPHT